MRKTILTSAVVVAALGLGANAMAKKAEYLVPSHSHSGDTYKGDYPKTDERGHVTYQPETYMGYTGQVFGDYEGRKYFVPHVEDKAMDDHVGSPQVFDRGMDNMTAPKVKAGMM